MFKIDRKNLYRKKLLFFILEGGWLIWLRLALLVNIVLSPNKTFWMSVSGFFSPCIFHSCLGPAALNFRKYRLSHQLSLTNLVCIEYVYSLSLKWPLKSYWPTLWMLQTHSAVACIEVHTLVIISYKEMSIVF